MSVTAVGESRGIVATYDYAGRNGTGLLYQKVRLDPKSFRHRRPDGNGGWIWNLDRVERVLYRLPQILAADPDEVIYYVEGEKDADRLAALGLLATTAGGASDWRPEMAETLRGRQVVILPDNDVPGHRHAQVVAKSLHGVALRVRVVELPGLPIKGDVSDWLDAGHTVDELAQLVGMAGEWAPEAEGEAPAAAKPSTVAAAIDVGPLPGKLECLADIREIARQPRIPIELGETALFHVKPGAIMNLAGPTGSGKTTLLCALWDRFARHHGYVYVLSAELPRGEIAARLVGQSLGLGWLDVLDGQASDADMDHALPSRFGIRHRKEATFAQARSDLLRLRAEYPGLPILLAVDYGQILAGTSDDIRMRVTDVWSSADELVRDIPLCLALMVAQMSRESSKAARKGERLGVESADGGAESAAIERYATITMELGGASEPDTEGRVNRILNIGKGRMGGGNRVWSIIENPRTGMMMLDGESESPATVRERQKTQAEDDRRAKEEAEMLELVQQKRRIVWRQLFDLLKGDNSRKAATAARLIDRNLIAETVEKAKDAIGRNRAVRIIEIVE